MKKYNPADFESKWRDKWVADKLYKTPEIVDSKEKFYSLYSFPYPSGAGLHVGHVEGMVANDIAARYYRMKGRAVIQPMGWDSFGLPAENYAIKTGVHPSVSTEEAIKTFIEQINNVGISIDWEKEVGAHRPDYYRWTQWIFIQLFNAGLAYKKTAPVNWCPKDQTVLANEQVINGHCERCDTEVIQKDLEQWFFKITDFADRLDKDLDSVDWPASTKATQRHWIGKSVGAEIIWSLDNPETKEDFKIHTFTTRFDTIPGPTFMVVAPEYSYVNKLMTSENKEAVEKYIKESKDLTDMQRQTEKIKTGVFTGSYAINPYNDEKVPIYVADYVLGGYGTGAVMGMPGHDARDYDFAKKFDLPVKYTLKPKEEGFEFPKDRSYEGEGYEINSGEFDGLWWEDAKEKIMEKLVKEGKAIKKTNYKIRDWLVSRQRYWGCPIPIVYDPEGKPHAMKDEDLPLLLPTDVDFKPTGESPITSSVSFKKLAEEKYGKGWHFEVDTMDTFVDSSWYYFRFCDALNGQEIFNTPLVPFKPLIVTDNTKNLASELKDTISILEKDGISCHLLGGLAMFALNRGFFMEDNDIDFMISSENGDELEKVKEILISKGYKFNQYADYKGAKVLKFTTPNNIELEIGNEFLGNKITNENKSQITFGKINEETYKIIPLNWLITHYENKNKAEYVDFIKALQASPANYWLPTDLYMIGAEHIVLHLLYSRFFTKFFFDKGLINFNEPFYRMRHMGLILGPDGRKMSKRWGNVINPDDEVKKFGADTVRMYEMFMGPLEDSKPWNDRTESGVQRFLSRVWNLQEKVSPFGRGLRGGSNEVNEESKAQLKLINKLIKKVSSDIETLSFNTAVAKFMEFTNEVSNHEAIDKSVWETFLKTLAPFAPFITEELWEMSGNSYSIHQQEWPSFDENLTKDETINMAVQINGKMRATIEIAFDSEQDLVLETAMENENIKKYVTGEPKKVIFVKNKILNIIV